MSLGIQPPGTNRRRLCPHGAHQSDGAQQAGLVAAYSNFNAAVTLSPTNEDANALVAVTRLLLLPQQPAGSNFLNSLGFSVSGRDIYNWTSMLPKDTNGNTDHPGQQHFRGDCVLPHEHHGRPRGVADEPGADHRHKLLAVPHR